MNEYEIRRTGNLIEIMNGAGLEHLLRDPLSYTHKVGYRGRELIARKKQKQLTGEPRNPKMGFFRTPLYRTTDTGSLVCPAGLRQKVQKTLLDVGLSTTYRDLRQRKWIPMDYARLAEIPGGLSFRHKQDLVLATIDGMEDGGVIVASTGFGKSHMARLLCAALPKSRIVFTSPGLDLMRGLYQPLKQLVHDVGRVGDGHVETSPRVLLSSADSLHRCDLGKTDLIIVDECHEIASPKRQAALAGQFTEAKIVGFTATPVRGDGAWPVIESLIGPVVLRVDYAEAQEHGMVKPIKVLMVHVPPIPGYSNSRDDVAWLKCAYWRNAARNRIIADSIRTLVPLHAAVPDPQVLVMVTRVDHAYRLRQHLPEYELVYGSEDEDRDEELLQAGLKRADEPAMTRRRRDDLRKAFEEQTLKSAIATFVWSRGVNFVDLPVLVRADGEQAEWGNTQIPGRLSRIGSVPFGLLLDFVDEYDPKAEARSRAREADYRSNGWTIQHVTAPPPQTPTVP